MKERGTRIELILVGLAFLAALSVLGLQVRNVEEPTQRNQNVEGRTMEVIAHRAGAAHAPENTLAALEGAIAAGADMAEIDVRQTGDGELVVLHDDSFGRTAGLDRKVWELDCRTARELDAGGWYDCRFRGEPVPTLEEMLTAAQGRIPLMIELKAKDCRDDLVRRTVTAIRDAAMEGECALASSSLELLRQVKTLAPELETVYIGERLPSEDEDCADSYSLDVNFLTEAAVAQAHAWGKKIRAWTVNSRREICRAISLGVDGLVTDDPELALKLCQTFGEGMS